MYTVKIPPVQGLKYFFYDKYEPSEGIIGVYDKMCKGMYVERKTQICFTDIRTIRKDDVE